MLLMRWDMDHPYLMYQQRSFFKDALTVLIGLEVSVQFSSMKLTSKIDWNITVNAVIFSL